MRFVLDTTNGRTYDFIQRIEDELDASDVQFKARRQPNDINDVDAKEASEDIQFNNQQSRKKRFLKQYQKEQCLIKFVMINGINKRLLIKRIKR